MLSMDNSDMQWRRNSTHKKTIYESFIKRPIDIICALLAIIVFFWLYALIAILVKVKLGSPVLFKQMRPGLNERIFPLYKFRTMTDERDENGELLPDEIRLTKFGKWLRSTSLDELPEAFNILNGSMSLIGPRPQLVRDMVFMSGKQRLRHTVKPGLSGLAQVNGRNGISWEEKLEWDLKYIRKITFLGDLKILFQTVGKVFKRVGVNREGTVSDMDFGDWLLKKNKVTKEEYYEKQNEAKKILRKGQGVKQNKVLIVASVISFIEWFNKENVEFLLNELGCEVHIAVNADYMEDTDAERTKTYLKQIQKEGVVIHNIKFSRSPFSMQNLLAYAKLKNIVNINSFDLIHCHTPAVSIMTRLAAKKARKHGSIVMYTCHGFHFHNASSKKNWILYYPIEKYCSRLCDYIITINKEDYERAKSFYAKNVRYIPGVGVDINRIRNVSIDKNAYKKYIGIPEEGVMILSIGELIERKNHEVIIRALGKLHDSNLYYVIAGKGPLKEYLEKLAEKLGVNLLLLGFRKDIPELCNAADISAFPSRIEGLGLAGIEAMAVGVPLVSSNVHGILDYVKNGKTGYAFKPDDIDGFAMGIRKLASSQKLRDKMKPECINAVEPFDLPNALNAMWDVYKKILCKEELK